MIYEEMGYDPKDLDVCPRCGTHLVRLFKEGILFALNVTQSSLMHLLLDIRNVQDVGIIHLGKMDGVITVVLRRKSRRIKNDAI